MSFRDIMYRSVDSGPVCFARVYFWLWSCFVYWRPEFECASGIVSASDSLCSLWPKHNTNHFRISVWRHGQHWLNCWSRSLGLSERAAEMCIQCRTCTTLSIITYSTTYDWNSSRRLTSFKLIKNYSESSSLTIQMIIKRKTTMCSLNFRPFSEYKFFFFTSRQFNWICSNPQLLFSSNWKTLVRCTGQYRPFILVWNLYQPAYDINSWENQA